MKNIYLAALLLVLSACQTIPYQPYARDVKKKPGQNGVIALKLDHRDEDKAKAQKMMETNCQNNPVHVVEEGEVVIGQESSTDATTSKKAGESSRSAGSLFGLPLMTTGSDPSEKTTSKVSTSQIKEWQISYECNQKKSTVR